MGGRLLFYLTAIGPCDSDLSALRRRLALATMPLWRMYELLRVAVWYDSPLNIEFIEIDTESLPPRLLPHSCYVVFSM